MALIKCIDCGCLISDKAAICPKCGAPMPISIECPECKSCVSLEEETCPNCGHPLHTSDIQDDKVKIEKVINHFNWGAFLIWPLWGFFNGIPYIIFISTALLIFLWYNYRWNNTNELILGGLIFLAISLLFGFKGGRWSWTKEDWLDIKWYIKIQRIWTKSGIGICLMVIGIYFWTKSNLTPISSPSINPSDIQYQHNENSSIHSDSDEDYNQKRESDRDTDTELTMRLLSLENKLRDTVDELSELYQTDKNSLRIELLKQRVVVYYTEAIEIARLTKDENLIREYDRRKEKAIKAMELMK